MSDELTRKVEQDYQVDPSAENAGKLLAQRAKSGETSDCIFVVTETVYDYNDNYFYTIEGDPVRIQDAYVSEDRAKKAAGIANVNCMLTLELDEFITDENYFFGDEDIDGVATEQYLAQYGLSIQAGNNQESGLKVFQQQLNDALAAGRINSEILLKIFDASSLNFYHVEKVNVKDGLCGEI